MWEIKSFEKQHAKKPKAIVMSHNIADIFWLECAPYIFKTDEAVFENPKDGYRRFMGVDVLVCSHIFGGDFKWALAE